MAEKGSADGAAKELAECREQAAAAEREAEAWREKAEDASASASSAATASGTPRCLGVHHPHQDTGASRTRGALSITIGAYVLRIRMLGHAITMHFGYARRGILIRQLRNWPRVAFPIFLRHFLRRSPPSRPTDRLLPVRW